MRNRSHPQSTRGWLRSSFSFFLELETLFWGDSGPRLFTAWLDNSSAGSSYFRASTFRSSVNPIAYPYSYLPYCQLKDVKLFADMKRYSNQHNLGEILMGDTVDDTPYFATMRTPVHCAVACEQKALTNTDIFRMQRLVLRNYHANFLIDGLPVISFNDDCLDLSKKTSAVDCQRIGVRIGTKAPTATKGVVNLHINNHIHFDLRYHRPPSVAADDHTKYRIVGAYASARSVNWASASQCVNSSSLVEPTEPLRLRIGEGMKLLWTYSIEWSEDKNTSWTNRYNAYLEAADDRPSIHRFAVVNALLTVLFLSALVALILLRTLHHDFNVYNDPDNAAEGIEETGWKLVHADVFRRPPEATTLAALVGSGAQLNLMVLATFMFGLLGFISPSKRGVTVMVFILMFVLLGFVSGYVTARITKMWGVQSWMAILHAATIVPKYLLAIFVVIEFFMWLRSAANAIPLTALLPLAGLWFGVSVPLHFVGAEIGYRQPALEPPKRVSEHVRPLKPMPWFLQISGGIPWGLLATGAVPFVASFMEIYFVINGVWQHRFYHVFGFLAVVFVLLLITVAEVVIVAIYFQLFHQDHRIWWNSFFFGAAPTIYFVFYSVYYFLTKLQLAYGWAAILYFGTVAQLSLVTAVMLGSVGFLATFFFTRVIYSHIRVE